VFAVNVFGSVTSKITTTDPPAGTVVFASDQVTAPLLFTEHEVTAAAGTPAQLFATYVVPVGSGSVSDVIVAGPEPLFVYVIWYSIVSPGFAVIGFPNAPPVVTSFATFTSADFGGAGTFTITGGVFVHDDSWLVHTVATLET
jgi:hypothetical protein